MWHATRLGPRLVIRQPAGRHSETGLARVQVGYSRFGCPRGDVQRYGARAAPPRLLVSSRAVPETAA